MSDFVHSSGQVLVSKIFWHMITNASIIASPKCLISSAGTLSTSGDCCVFSIWIASSTSAQRMAYISIFILRQCSEDVVICVQFVVVEFFTVLSPSPKYCLFFGKEGAVFFFNV